MLLFLGPVRVCVAFDKPGTTHQNAGSDDDWYNSLHMLISDDDLRKTLGMVARRHFAENYELNDQAKKLVEVFREVLR